MEHNEEDSGNGRIMQTHTKSSPAQKVSCSRLTLYHSWPTSRGGNDQKTPCC